MSGRQPVTAQCAVLMADKLRAKARTIDELVRITGLKKPTIARWINHLRVDAVRVVRVEGWLPNSAGRCVVPKFRWDSKPDAPRPGRESSTLRMRRVRAARKTAA
jgi:hypothetical protein